jgi:hypothetical protein
MQISRIWEIRKENVDLHRIIAFFLWIIYNFSPNSGGIEALKNE